MNMTTLNFALTRAAGRDFAAGDEILTTALDHDGGVAPWVELAADKGLTVHVAAATDELHVDYDDLERKLVRQDPRRRLRARLERDRLGRRRPADLPRSPARPARSPGSTPSTTRPTSRSTSSELGCDVLLCSPYKFCGPHLGIAYLRAEVAERWRPYKARPSSSSPLGRRFETGTLPVRAARGLPRHDRLPRLARRHGSAPRLRAGARRALPGGASGQRDALRPARDGRPRADLPASTSRASRPSTVARTLAERGIGVWYADNWYCVGLADRLPPTSLRIGLIHYNTAGRGRPARRRARLARISQWPASTPSSSGAGSTRSPAARCSRAAAGASACSSETTGSAARSRRPRSPSPGSTTTSSRPGTRSGSAAPRTRCSATSSPRAASST